MHTPYKRVDPIPHSSYPNRRNQPSDYPPLLPSLQLLLQVRVLGLQSLIQLLYILLLGSKPLDFR